jgi:hypothetical protein
MQEAWRESVEKDVSCLREVLAQYKEQAERLEMQKKLLLSQVGGYTALGAPVQLPWGLWLRAAGTLTYEQVPLPAVQCHQQQIS